MIHFCNFRSIAKYFSIVFVILLSISAIACENITGNDEVKELANYTDAYTFNFDSDFVSIAIKQGSEELGRGANPEIATVDTSLTAGKVILEFDVNPVDIFADKPSPNIEFEFFEEKLNIWYSTEKQREDPINKSRGDGTISTPPAVPAYIITHIRVKKNAHMNVNINYLQP